MIERETFKPIIRKEDFWGEEKYLIYNAGLFDKFMNQHCKNLETINI